MPTKSRREKTPAAQTAGVSSAQKSHTNERTKQMNSITTQHSTPSLVIGDVTILQDEEGRYSLNDLHSAAGGADKHSPRKWLRYQQAQDLIAVLEGELTDQNQVLTDLIRPVKTTEGRYGGSFVVKELVYAYAMWISAVFSLRVIRAYDETIVSSKGRNLSIGMSVSNWLRSVGMGKALMKDLAECSDLGVATGLYGTLLHVHRVCGMTTPALERLAPGLRQQLLAFDVLDRSSGGAS